MDNIRLENDITEHGHTHHDNGQMYTHTHTHTHDDYTHTHTHAHSLISTKHSTKGNEWLTPQYNVVVDDEQTAKTREAYLKNPDSKEAILSLANSLCHQMRYNDAKKYFDLLTKLYPNGFTSHRRRGFCSMATLDFDTATNEFLWCEPKTSDLLDIRYRLGCCAYYKGDYQKAREYFISCYDLTKTNGPMHVAIVYWHILCSVRLGESVKDALSRYDNTLDAGHHTGYLAILIRLLIIR